jgi:uncharacterized protein YdiU (UPF0061 family)
MQEWGLETTQESMGKYNPMYIPRNHMVEEVLDLAVSWDYQAFHEFLKILKTPYTKWEDTQKYMSSLERFDKNYQTYCGT